MLNLRETTFYEARRRLPFTLVLPSDLSATPSTQIHLGKVAWGSTTSCPDLLRSEDIAQGSVL